MSTYVGIDVSKRTLDVAWIIGEKQFHIKVKNEVEGFIKIISSCPVDSHFVMEATGVYHLRSAFFFVEQNVQISVVNPLVVKRFGEMNLRRIKTDKADAILIARYGTTQHPKQWVSPSIEILKMQQLWTLSDKIIVQKRMTLNQLEAFLNSPHSSVIATSAIEDIVAVFNKELLRIETELTRLSQEFYSREMEILTSIPGIGIKTSIGMIVASRGFGNFDTGRELNSFFGLTPAVKSSGTSIHSKGKITKMGQARMRSLLYMCALSAVKRNSGCQQMYDRLIGRGKPAKLALTAVAAKLVRQAVAMIKADTLFNYKKSLSTCI